MSGRVTVLNVIAAIAVAAVLTTCLAGCGGTSRAGVMTVSGVVSDVEGNLVPNATVTITGSRASATSAFNGAYKLNAGVSGWQLITATANIGGRTWRGRQAVQVFTDGPTMNVNLVVGQSDKLGSITGQVRDGSGFPVEGVRVFVSATYGSSYDITAADGTYLITDLPASVRVDGADQSVQYVMTASRVGFANQTRSEDDTGAPITVAPGLRTTINFVITATAGSPVPVPDPWTISATAWTFPEVISRSGGPYDAIRAKISPEALRAIGAKSTSRAAREGSLIEIDISWYTSWTDFLNANFGGFPPDNLAGFAIYRRAGAVPTSDADRIYFERQPLLTDFFDMSPELTDGTRYHYRITALNTNFLDMNDEFDPNSESPFSSSASAIPLDQVLEIAPANNASVNASGLTFSWQPLNRARSYTVFVYDRFPEMQATGVTTPFPDQVVEPIAELGPVVGTSVSGPSGLISGTTYYWAVIASDSDDFEQGEAFSIGELRKFTVR